MAEDIQVKVTEAHIISALNTPGGAVNEWRNDVEREVLDEVFVRSPVNDELNAVHRDGVVGVFKASWVTRRYGNGHRIGFNIENFADHAIYVEEGRRGSRKHQRFSWTEWEGDIRVVGGRGSRAGDGTRPRTGMHILRNVVNQVMERETGGSFTPLT